MGLRQCIGYLLAEHDELYKLADRIEGLLESASKTEFSEHIKTFTELRSLEHSLAGITAHCHAAERLVESSFYENFRQGELARINADHLQIIQAVASFKEELKCATPDRTLAMIVPGMDVVKLLRAHVAYEGGLFRRIAEVVESHGKAGIHKNKASTASERKRIHVARRKTQKKVNGAIPYTVEPHPEL